MAKAKRTNKRSRRVTTLFSIAAVGIAVVLLGGVNISHSLSMVGKMVVVLLGFGLVILVHEFGHFIAAKLSDIHVEAFSIGFPPVFMGIQRTEKGYRIRILPGKSADDKKDDDNENQQEQKQPRTFYIGGTKKAGETEYQIGCIPLGGFVKMLGQEDSGKAEPTDDPRSYTNKSVGARMIVISAGVCFNVICAMIIFVTVSLVGIKQVPAVIGQLKPGYPAAMAGLRAGDEIIEINGKSTRLTFKDIAMAAALSGKNEKIPLKVRHEDGSVEDIELAAEQTNDGGQLKSFGILPPESLKIAKLDSGDANELFTRTALKPADIIKQVNGVKVAEKWQFDKVVENIIAPDVTVMVQRTTDKNKTDLIETKLPLKLYHANGKNNGEYNLGHICSIVPRLCITSVLKTPKQLKENHSYLQSDDIILAAGNIENPTYKELRDVTTAHKDKELPIKILRTVNGASPKTFTVNVHPEQAPDSNRVIIGIGVGLDMSHPVVAKTIDTKKLPAPLAIPRGAKITAVDGTKITDFYQFVSEIRKKQNGRIGIEWRLNEQKAGIVAVNIDNNADKLITVRSGLGEYIPLEPLQKLYKANGPVEAIIMGYQTTISLIANAYQTLQSAVSGQVHPKNFMGPIGILSFGYKIVSARPIIYYVYFIGLINAFIAVFNFLPLLPFDGGHILFMLIEKIKGSPVNERIQLVATNIGWILVGTLFLYVTFNDIIRNFITKSF